MGAKKQWTGKEKLAIVLQGLKGERSISELCNDHGITQGMFTSGVTSCCPMGQSCSSAAAWITLGNGWSTKIVSSKKPSEN